MKATGAWSERDEGDDAAAKAARRAVRYQTATGEEQVYLHPRSALHKAPPELVVFSELIRTEKRPYMSGAPAIAQNERFHCIVRSEMVLNYYCN